MRYTIYEMIKPSHLTEVELDGYYPKSIHRDVLQKLDIHGIEEEHPTMEAAIAEINAKKDQLKNLQLTIVPVISISWDGELV